MSWDLMLVIDLADDADRAQVVACLLKGPLGPRANGQVTFEWLERVHVRQPNEWSMAVPHEEALEKLPAFYEAVTGTHVGSVAWACRGDVWASVHATGRTAFLGRGVRRSLGLLLGNDAAWSPVEYPEEWEPTKLADGLTADVSLVVQLVRELAATVRIRNLRLLAEQEVHDRISQHLAFHSDPREYLDDLVEIVKLGLRGGAHYPQYDERRPFAPEYDGRSNMGPIASAPDDSYFVFLGRRKAARAALRETLATLGPLVDQHGIPPELDAAWVRDQLRQAPDCVLFESDDGGLGVHDFPFLGTNYLDGPYLTLLRAVAARLAGR